MKTQEETMKQVEEAMLNNPETENDDIAAWQAQAEEEIFAYDQKHWAFATESFINKHFVA